MIAAAAHACTLSAHWLLTEVCLLRRRQVSPDDSRIVLEIQEAARQKARAAAHPKSKIASEETLHITAEAGLADAAPAPAPPAQRMSRFGVRNSGAGLSLLWPALARAALHQHSELGHAMAARCSLSTVSAGCLDVWTDRTQLAGP